VAWGMLAAAEVGRQRCGLGASDVATHYRLMSRLDLPDPARRLGGLDRDAIRSVLAADNKRGYGPCAADEVLMVVLEAVGRPAVAPPLPLVAVPMEVLMAALDTVAQAAEGALR
jgi:3-dehydroquinate synthetase